jgi:type III restriction enzyme
MKFELRDYQRDAAIGVLNRLSKATDNWTEHSGTSSFALSAITGSGKTVIATAVIEALVHGSPDFDCEADPNVSFLWVTDDPALNRQTRNKMLEASELLQPARLIELDNSFLNPELEPGRVYFLNVQKLSKNAGLNHGGNNLREHSMWEIIGNTITRGRTNLVLILDEAHKGMKRVSDRKTIVRQIIDGRPGSNPPVPVVWGISATIDRFKEAMKDLSERDTYAPVEVDTARVRASGLLKDEIGLDDPDESGTFSTTLLREAVKDTLEFERRWAAYSAAEGEPEVLPVLVVQVPDKASDAKLAETLGTIDSEWPGLGPDAVAHVFGEHEPLIVGGRKVPWVPPESIQGDTDIRVVLAKTAISTGWDCPRAEVLYSERPAKDATHIAQIIGRMVRAPLARRITTDDVLNSVSCYLPLFDRGGLSTIKAELEGRGKSKDDTVGPEIIRKPRVFERNAKLQPEVFDAVETIQSLPAPDSLANPLRRAKHLAALLADSPSGQPSLVPDAGQELRQALNARLDGLAAEFANEVADQFADLNSTEIHRTTTDTFGTEQSTATRSVKTHLADLDRDTRKVVRSIREGVGTDYLEYRARRAGEDADLFDIRVEVAALLRVSGVIDEIEARATKWVQEHLSAHAVAISNTTGATRDAYRRVQEQANSPEPMKVELRANEKVATQDSDGTPLPTYDRHLFADRHGRYPVSLNSWEQQVLELELSRPSTVAWYRNPSRPIPSAVRIAYQDDSGGRTSLQVDFVVVSRRDDGSLGLSLLDPHGTHLSDGRAKLHALADYAEQFGTAFVRIESLAEIDGSMLALDFLDPSTRSAVRDFDGGDVTALYQSEAGKPYL